ncbi:transcriptional regulator [Bordetella trematum]|uniref:Transcriptional regulator n=2 Tax=Bordetella trematum TaxID=123899 RepID=A0A157S832_9BORD|nr:transcriptional regulator [Bordetella trematum]SAI66555.1 transcriptional regulator [Bordetella trematum]SUV96551.1 transcriptional regulator [Bordetella trematum]
MGKAGVALRDQPGVIESWSVSREWLEKNVRSAGATNGLCIVTGFGDSMRPMFNPGDPLIVDSSVKSVDYDAVYFFRVDNEGFIKRLQRVPGKGLLAISENPAYRDWVIDPTMDFEVFGRVLKVWCSHDF